MPIELLKFVKHLSKQNLNQKPILIHFHIHHRRTGVTSSIENVLPFLEIDFDTYLYGNQVNWENRLSYTRLKKLLKNNPNSIIHAHRNNEIIRALWLRLLGFRFKLIVTRHAATTPSSLTLKLMKKADEKIGLIDSMRELPFDTTIIGHGVNINRFKPKEEISIDAIVQQNFILVAGRVRPKKGHDSFIKALVPVLKENSNWAAVIIGKIDDQEFVDKLKKIIGEQNLARQVYFIPETKSIEAYYQASKVTVIPSHSEGFSLVCLEAMACGSITVATKGVGIHSTVIEDQKTGFLFDVGNHQQLQTILSEIVKGNHAISTVQAIASIKTKWSAQIEANKLKEVYLRPTKH